MSDSLPPKPAPGRFLRVALVCLCLLLFAVLAAGLFALDKRNTFLTSEGPLTEPADVIIERGLSVKGIAEKLAAAGIVEDAQLFELGVRFVGDKAPIKAGEFSISPGSTMAQVLTVLQTATPVQYRLLVREGITAAQAITIVENETRLYGEIKGVYPEGSLLPDTYFFVRGESRDVLLGRMRMAMDEIVQQAWDARTDTTELKTPAELLILASIIEKETSRDSEKPMVSGVFYNRLRKGMKLQSDPTVIYGISQGPLGRSLKRKDVRTPTPYNTYTIKRLPPGPIALPSKEAVFAAGQPAKTDALFFVVSGKGGHVFAKTYAEHKRNIRNWLQYVRSRKKK